MSINPTTVSNSFEVDGCIDCTRPRNGERAVRALRAVVKILEEAQPDDPATSPLMMTWEQVHDQQEGLYSWEAREVLECAKNHALGRCTVNLIEDLH